MADRTKVAWAVALVGLVVAAVLIAITRPTGGQDPATSGRLFNAQEASRLVPEGQRYVSAWVPYWTYDAGMKSFTDNSELFTELTTFFHTVVDNGRIQEWVSPQQRRTAIDAAHEGGVPAIAAVIDNTPAKKMARIISKPKTRQAHIEQLLELVDDDGYDGIDIDYEQFAFADGTDTWPKTMKNWTTFIEELSAQLRLRDKSLTVAVPPVFNGEQDGSSGYWVYNWPGIEPYIDTLRVMTYDYSLQSPGPISPIDYAERALDYGLEVFGPEKFRLGVPTYGRDWIQRTKGKCAGVDLDFNKSRTADRMLAVAAEQGKKVQFDEETKEAFFGYLQTDGKCRAGHRVHFSDARSVAAKADLATSRGTGIALWSLGGEDPATWDKLREYSVD